MDAKTKRRINQILLIDQFLGLDATPIRQAEHIQMVPAAHLVDTQVNTPAPPPPAKPTRKRNATRSNQPTTVEPVQLPPLPATSLTTSRRAELLESLNRDFVEDCRHCHLCQKRIHTVFGEGDPDAELMFVGEGPGADEDRQGRPFVGRAGQKLTDMIHAMGLTREKVFIANIVKCRPPGNRVPTLDEATTCVPYLHRQIELIQPKVIVALGATASKYLLNEPRLMITKARGHWRAYRGIKLMPTFHPAYLLRSYTRENRQRVWNDLLLVLDELGIELPKRR